MGRTPNELMRSVTNDELREMLAFVSIEPHGWAGVMAALRLIIKQNAHGLLGVKELDLEDILPGWRPSGYDEEKKNRKAWARVRDFFQRMKG